MLFSLIQKFRGRSEVVMTDSRVKVQARMKTLRSSRNGAEFSIVPCEGESEKFRKVHKHRSH